MADNPKAGWHPVLRERIAVIFLQPQCNMTCRFCVTEDGFDALSMEQAACLLAALRAGGVGNVILGGGEPFHWKPGVLELARLAKAAGFFTQIGTNGIAMPAEAERAPEVDRYILPLESADARIHNHLRRYRDGHHAVVLDRLERLGRAGKSVTVSTVVTRDNLEGLPELARWLATYHRRYGGLHAWHLYRLVQQGRGGRIHGAALAVTPAAYAGACARAQAAAPGLTLYRRLNMLASSTVGFFWVERGVLKTLSPFGPGSTTTFFERDDFTTTTKRSAHG